MKRKYYNIQGHLHFLTFSCFQRRQLLVDPLLCRWLADGLNRCRTMSLIRVYAYVFMPEHVHLMVHPINEVYSIGNILRHIKEPFARRVNAHWEKTEPDTIASIRVQVGERSVRRFWQAGGGFDRNITDYDSAVRTIEYIENNPVRRQLVTNPTEWAWSSAAARIGKGNGTVILDEFRPDILGSD
ncbi:MAG: transposase [candidate division Zixibacteria bacterium]|jgi:putative transposase|nr:transposase [candidate division Zixibacteria bacterium]